MKRIGVLVLLVLAVAPMVAAQTTDEYKKLRKQYGITQAAGVEALETLVGTRVVEIKGVVKGTVRTGESGIVMLKTDDGSDLHIEAQQIPDWLDGNEIPARLLVQAERLEDLGMLRATLLAATSNVDDPAFRTVTAPAKSKASGRSPGNSSSRGMPPPLTGNIGKGAPSNAAKKNWQIPASDALPYYAAFIKKRNKRLPDSEAWRIAQGVIGFSIKYGVDARLIMAMVLCESNFNPNDTSRSGAMGLGQLMPGTAKGLGVTNAYDSIDNLYGTVRMVRGHLERYQAKTGDSYQALVLMLASYNAGSGAVRRAGGVPPIKETQNYVRKVIAVYRQLCGG